MKQLIESLLDMDEVTSDNSVLIDNIYKELTEEYGLIAWVEDQYFPRRIKKTDISINSGKIKFPDKYDKFVTLDFTVIPDIFKEYKLDFHNIIKIKNYRGKISRLPVTNANIIDFENCTLDFDKKLKCSHVSFINCGFSNLKISQKQPWKTFNADMQTKQRLFNTYMEMIAPNAEEQ